ncbi:hypothetical protein QTP86_025670, partial [Hemibagrus guttatus]
MTSALVMLSNIRHAGQTWTILTLRPMPIAVIKPLKQSPAKATTISVRCSSVTVTVRLLNALLCLNIMTKQ